MICCVFWCRTGQDGNGLKWMKQKTSCGLKAAVRFTANATIMYTYLIMQEYSYVYILL